MSETKKTAKLLSGICETCRTHKVLISTIVILADVLLIAYYLVFFLLMDQVIWEKIYIAVNPFTIGAYMVGVIVLLHYIIYDSWVIKILISIFYVMVIVLSLVALMGITRASELLIYAPHPLIIVLCGIVAHRKFLASHNRAGNERT